MSGLIRRTIQDNPPLALTGILMLLSPGILVPALWLDPRMLNGELLWIKPIKFAVSIALYALTLQLILRHIEGGARTQKFVRMGSWAIAFFFLVEVIAIFGQAARGKVSHFNSSTAFDGIVFNIMGTAIMLLFIVHIGLTILLLRQTNTTPDLASALRAGLAVTALGMLVAYLMVIPRPEQMALLEQGMMPERMGSHTIGAPDGGPGIPVTGWSSVAGDLRIAHFIGLHALQVIPLFAFWLTRRSTKLVTQQRRNLVRVFAFAYAGIVVLFTVQALRGQSVLAPDVWTLVSFVGLAVLTAGGVLAAIMATGRHSPSSQLSGNLQVP